MFLVINRCSMRSVAVVFLAIVVTVQCMPRLDLGSSGMGVPTDIDGKGSIQPDVNVDEKGELEVKETKRTHTENKQEESEESAEGFEHTGPNGESVQQSSEKKSTHSRSDSQDNSESKSLKVGKGGLAMREDKSSTSETKEENTETGKQHFKQSSGNDPDHKHTYESESQYKNSNQTRDRHHKKSHDQFSVGPDLQTSSQHEEESSDQHDEKQSSQGTAMMKQEDYDRNGKNVRHTGKMSKSAYDNKSSKSTGTSTSKKEKHSSKGDGDKQEDKEIGSNASVDEKNQADTEAETETGAQNDVEANEQSQINAESSQNSNSDAESDVNSQGQASNDATRIETGQINQAVEGTGQISTQNGHQSSDSDAEINTQSEQTAEKNSTNNQMNAETDQSVQTTNTESEENTQNDKTIQSSQAEEEHTNGAESNGHKFHVNRDFYRELEREERVLGLIRDDQTSSIENRESSKLTDYSKLRDDFLLSIAQSIHNSKIVSDGHGNARIFNPHHKAEELRYSSADFRNLASPYRTLAQRYGTSPVSSHYENALIIESKYDDLPSLFGFSNRHNKLKIKELIDSKELNRSAGKSRHGVRNLFGRGNKTKYGNGVASLQLSPFEWEERARKEAELQNTARYNHETKITETRAKKINKIDPLVRKAILSRDLDDMLKSGKTSPEIDIMELLNIETKTNNSGEALISSHGNKSFEPGKDLIKFKSDYEFSRPSYDSTPDISKVITNEVNLVTTNHELDSRIIPGNIENNFENLGLVPVEEPFNTLNKVNDKGIIEMFTDKITFGSNVATESSKNSYLEDDNHLDNLNPTFQTERNFKSEELSVKDSYALSSGNSSTRDESNEDIEILNSTTESYNIYDSDTVIGNSNITLDENKNDHSNVSTLSYSTNSSDNSKFLSVDEESKFKLPENTTIPTLHNNDYEKNEINMSALNNNESKFNIYENSVNKQSEFIDDVSKNNENIQTTTTTNTTVSKKVTEQNNDTITVNKKEIKINNNTDAYESNTYRNNITDQIVAQEKTQKNTEDKLENKRSLEETDTVSDTNSMVIEPESNINTTSKFEDKSNITVIIDDVVVNAFFNLTHPTPTATTDKNSSNVISNKLNHKIVSNISSDNLNDTEQYTTIVATSTTTEILDDDSESSERSARSTLDIDEEFELENSDITYNSTSQFNNPSVIDPNVESNTSNMSSTSIFTQKESAKIKDTNIFLNSTKKSEEKGELAKIANFADKNVTDNLDTKKNATNDDIVPDDSTSKKPDVSNNFEIYPDSTLNLSTTTSHYIVTTEKNKKIKDFAPKIDITTEPSKTSTDVSSTSIKANGEIKPDVVNADSTVKRDFSYIDNTNAEPKYAGTPYNTSIAAANSTSSTEHNFDNETTENGPMGNDSQTQKPITEVGSENPQNDEIVVVNPVSEKKSTVTEAIAETNKTQATTISEDTIKSNKSEVPVNLDTSAVVMKEDATHKKTDNLDAIAKANDLKTTLEVDKPLINVKQSKPETAKLETRGKSKDFLATLKSDREKEESKGEVDEATSKSEESRSISMERLIYASGIDSANVDNSASTSDE